MPSSPKSSPWRARLPWLLGAILLALIVAGLWPKAIPVETATATRGPLVVTVDEEGMTRVKHRYEITAPVAGQLRRIDYKAGARVEAGKTILATLETAGADLLDARGLAEARAKVGGTEAARAAADARHTAAAATARTQAADLARIEKLHTQHLVSDQEIDAARLRATSAAGDERAAAFSLQVAEYDLRQARAVLTRGAGDTTEPLDLVSPIDGVILRVDQESARVVPAGFPLLEIGDPADLEARIEVLSRDAVAISPGARVTLGQWGGGAPLAGRVRTVEPSAFTKVSALGVEEQRVYVAVDFTDPPAAHPTLGDSYRVEARIVTWENPDVLQVPAGALFQRGQKWQCFTVSGGRAHLTEVRVGHSDGLATEILGGLAQDAEVIVYPGDKISDSTRISHLKVSE